MNFSYFLTAIMIEAISFMVPLALTAGLLCKNMKMALWVAVAFGLVGAMQTHIHLMFEFCNLQSMIWMHSIAKFVDLVLVVLLTQAFKDMISKRIIKQAENTKEEHYAKARICIGILGIIVGIAIYFMLPVVGVGIILGSFFKRPSFSVIAGAIWVIFYIFVLYFIFFAEPMARTSASTGSWLWLPWDSVIIALMLPPLTTYAEQALARKLACRQFFLSILNL